LRLAVLAISFLSTCDAATLRLLITTRGFWSLRNGLHARDEGKSELIARIHAAHDWRADLALLENIANGIEVRNNAQGWLPKPAWDWINANVPGSN
jgi:hypothetical protein